MASIETLLQDEAAALADFLSAINAERHCLSGGDLNALPATTSQKSALATRLAGLESARDAALRDAGFEPGRSGMERWLAMQAPAKSQAALKNWNTVLERAAEAKRENDVNGALIATRLQHNQQALGTLLGDTGESATYGADGQRNAGSGRRNLGSA